MSHVDNCLKPIFVLLTVWLLLFVGCRAAEEEILPTPFAGNLMIDAPETAVVGQPLEVLVTVVDAPDKTAVTLTLQGSYGLQLLRAEVVDEVAWFDVLPKMIEQTGRVQLLARAGASTTAAQITLEPDLPIEPIIPLVGARSIQADGSSWAIATIIPFDQYGNPVAEGTAVSLRSLHPGDVLRSAEPEVRHLLAWERVYSGTTAGKTIVAANVEDVYGPETVIREIAGWPEQFGVTTDVAELPADGFQLMTLRTTLLKDKFGNILPDGTLATFLVTHAGETVNTIPAQVIDGVAEGILQAPRQPGAYQVAATVSGVLGSASTVTFTPGPANQDFPVRLTVDGELNALQVSAGPIIGDLDQYVPDGTPVQIQIQTPAGDLFQETAVVEAGYANLSLPGLLLRKGVYAVQATAGTGEGRVSFEKQ